MGSRLQAALALTAAAFLLASCGGGGGGGGPANANPSAPSTIPGVPPADALLPAEVQRIVAQAAAEAQARGSPAHIVVVDRVGHVLAAYRMTGAPETIAIASGLGVTGGLDGIARGTVPAVFSAITKAITGAYLSSGGNAFSTRTAGQIIQEHFDPQEAHQPSGPLYGVQFSQLTCSDVMQKPEVPASVTVGPMRSPLGLAADPGGLPLYKNGFLVGGIGVEANGLYTLDRDITDFDDDVEEHIAVAGTFGFDAPADIRGDRITADGRVFRFVDSFSTRADPANAPALATLPGALVTVDGYVASLDIPTGAPFGSNRSGMRLDATFAGVGGWTLVDSGNNNRFPPRDASDGTINAAEVKAILTEAVSIARRARGQIRRPLGSFAEVSIAIVDRNGDILGFVRTPDAPVFGIDVSVQKARTALFFSHPDAESDLLGTASIAGYARSFRDFLGVPNALKGGIAFTPRAIGNLHRPFYPDGIEGTPPGPLSTPIAQWSPFNVGFQLDLVYNQLIKGILGDLSEGCTGLRKLRNGAQIFPGGVPIYRNGQLVGAIGVSGDGVDQDDMISFLAVANGGRASGLANAPAAMRADTLAPMNARLRYVQCPQSPFNDSSEQNVCAGL